MAHVKRKKGVIGILTGGGDVPGLNVAIKAVVVRAEANEAISESTNTLHWRPNSTAS